MPGAAGRRGAMSRLSSSVVRGAPVGPGQPGVYRVRRAPTHRAPTDTVWITPPPVAVTGELRGWLRVSHGDDHPELDKGLSDVEAWAGGTVTDTGTTPYGLAAVGMVLVWQGLENHPVHDGHGASRVHEGSFGLDFNTVRSAGETAFGPPPDAILHPGDEYVVLSTQVAGLALGFADAFGYTTPISVRQVDPADYVYDPVDPAAGPVFYTSTMINAAPVVASTDAVTPDQSESEADQTASLNAISWDVTWDTIGGLYEKAAVYILSLDDWAPAGAVWNPPTSHDDHGARLIATTGLDYGNPFGQPLATWTAVVQPPRYRVPALPATLWDRATHFYYKDAGLWLGGDFTDLAGYPTALPADASQLDFVILPSGTDPAAEDFYYTGPFADYNIYNAPPITNDHFDSGDANAGAGAHLWVLWHGPAGLVASDPVPSTTDPMSLVPAALAANGTA